jgi:hypothetical protein
MIRPFARCWNSQCKWVSGSKRGMRNQPRIDRRNFRIDRSGCRNRSVESSGNREIDSPVDRPSASPNRKVIVNPFTVIVNHAALNPSKIYQSRAPIHQFASESSTLRNQIRNRPVKIAGKHIRNYPQPAWPGSATAESYHVVRRQATFLFSESSDNRPINSGNHPTDSANLPIIYRRIPVNYRSGQATNCT